MKTQLKQIANIFDYVAVFASLHLRLPFFAVRSLQEGHRIGLQLQSAVRSEDSETAALHVHFLHTPGKTTRPFSQSP